jgi:hypothetical protein
MEYTPFKDGIMGKCLETFIVQKLENILRSVSPHSTGKKN